MHAGKSAERRACWSQGYGCGGSGREGWTEGGAFNRRISVWGSGVARSGKSEAVKERWGTLSWGAQNRRNSKPGTNQNNSKDQTSHKWVLNAGDFVQGIHARDGGRRLERTKRRPVKGMTSREGADQWGGGLEESGAGCKKERSSRLALPIERKGAVRKSNRLGDRRPPGTI